MTTTFPKLKRNEDGLFGPTKANHYYKPVYHGTQSRKPKKNKWRINEYEQYGVFKIGSENHWFCEENAALFSIVDFGRTELGQNGEVLGFFPQPKNPLEAWHGFPTTSDSKTPSEVLLDIWQQAKIIDPILRKRLGKGKI